jgi:hypothetical protein
MTEQPVRAVGVRSTHEYHPGLSTGIANRRTVESRSRRDHREAGDECNVLDKATMAASGSIRPVSETVVGRIFATPQARNATEYVQEEEPL